MSNNFDAVRLVAALGVLVSHSFPIWGHIPDPLQLKMSGLPIGEVSVAVFFILSGYLVAQSWMSDPAPLRYLARRGLRLLPALYVIIMLSTFVAGPLLTTLQLSSYWSSSMTWAYLKGFGVFWLQGSLPGVFETCFYPLAFNGPFWSLKIELACYLLLMAAGMAGVFRRRGAIALLAIVATCAFLFVNANAQKYQTWSFLYMNLHAFTKLASFFFAGSALYVWREHIPRLPLVALALAACLFYSAGSIYFPLLWHTLLPYVVLCLALTPIAYVKDFGRYGDFSYGMYIYAWPVQQTVASKWGGQFSITEYIAICSSIAMVFAYLSWHLVEKRALALKPKNRGDRAGSDHKAFAGFGYGR